MKAVVRGFFYKYIELTKHILLYKEGYDTSTQVSTQYQLIVENSSHALLSCVKDIYSLLRHKSCNIILN
jgi:hypothetical protein